MSNSSKIISLILIGTIAFSCLTILTAKPVNAQSLPTPSIPEFTAKYVDRSYYAAPSSSINPYTGQQVTTEGHHVENRTIELTIKNQPFTSYLQNGQNISFYYNVREKGPYEQNWTNVYTVDNYFAAQSSTGYTTLVYLVDANAPPLWENLVNGGTVEFQVQAMIGYISRSSGFASWYFSGQSSDWSPTQTVTVPVNSNSPTPTSTVPELPWLVIVPLLLSVFAVAVIVVYRKVTRG